MISSPLEKTYPATASTVPLARHAVARFAQAAGLARERLDALRLAVSEAVSNAVTHAYPGGDGAVRVHAAVSADELVVVVTDSGCGLSTPAKQPGLGFGLRLMANASNGLDARERPGGGTEVRMVFALAPQPAGAETPPEPAAPSA